MTSGAQMDHAPHGGPKRPDRPERHNPRVAHSADAAWSWHDGWRYGLMGLPLAFVALPLYVLLPNHHAREFGLGLGTLGALLLGVRLFDAVIDPWLGRWADHLFARSPARVLHWGAVAATAVCGGFAMLFFPPAAVTQQGVAALLTWLAISLLLTTVAYSGLSILHQAWGARLGGNEAKRSRVVAWREGFGLAGIVLASIWPLAHGLPATVALLCIASVVAWWAWQRAPVPLNGVTPSTQAVALWLPWTRPGFRALMAVYMLNGIASAVPATLILFFVQDRLQAPPEMEPLFLGSYFLCAALALPVWMALVPRLGLARTWAMGMVLSVAVFGFASQLGAGDGWAFALVCALSGVAMGTDLAMPAALLNGHIQTNGDRGQAEGAYLGWWAFATKLNLALAAGLALPLLGAFGYTPGARDAEALNTLTWAYCLLPCALKTLALALLSVLFLRKTP